MLAEELRQRMKTEQNPVVYASLARTAALLTMPKKRRTRRSTTMTRKGKTRLMDVPLTESEFRALLAEERELTEEERGRMLIYTVAKRKAARANEAPANETPNTPTNEAERPVESMEMESVEANLLQEVLAKKRA